MSKPAMRLDPATGQWKIDYSQMTEGEVVAVIRSSVNEVDKAREVIADLLPAAAAQAILNRGAVAAYEMVIRMAKRSPEKLLELII